MAKLPPRYNSMAMPLVVATLMTFIVSGVSTWRVIGITPGFLGAWMGAWVWSWIVAFPVLLVIMPLARRLVGLIVEPPPGMGR